MKSATLSTLIEAPSVRIHEVLLAAPQLPEWNPAFRTVAGIESAGPGERYKLEIIRGLRGTLHYPRITAEAVMMEWEVPGMWELGTWSLESDGSSVRTRVTHTVQRSGPLAAILSGALDTLPSLRLERLAQHLAGVK